jgi:hypothetical protein
MSIYTKFKTDKNREKDGVTLDYGDGVMIHIARAGGSNTAYLKAMEKMYRKHRRQIQLETLPEETAAKLLREIWADTVVLGWEGITDEKTGGPIEFSRDACIKLFEDLPDLFVDIREQATSAALFREANKEEDAKN